MHHTRQITIILPDTLRSIGLGTLLADYFAPIEITPFPTFEALAASGNERYDYYFTDADCFARNADFFLPRRDKTMLLTAGSDAARTPSAIRCLPLAAPQEEILERLRRFLDSDAGIPSGEGNRELSTRETDVLQLIVRGSTNKEIADRLNISLNTVLTHRKNITSKLGVKTVSGLTFYAIMHGLVAGEDIEL